MGVIFSWIAFATQTQGDTNKIMWERLGICEVRCERNGFEFHSILDIGDLRHQIHDCGVEIRGKKNVLSDFQKTDVSGFEVRISRTNNSDLVLSGAGIFSYVDDSNHRNEFLSILCRMPNL